MKSRLLRYVIALGIVAASSVLVEAAQIRSVVSPTPPVFRVTSTTFSNGGTIPLSMLGNKCAVPIATAAGGGNESPELSWTSAPKGTRSFVVIAYDVTASFTYWGMYNIDITSAAGGLPEDAGVAGSTFGDQVENDLGDRSYDGPCPVPQVGPLHSLVFTVYALNIVLLEPPTTVGFPPNAETLYHFLIDAGRGGHILASASIGGFFAGGT